MNFPGTTHNQDYSHFSLSPPTHEQSNSVAENETPVTPGSKADNSSSQSTRLSGKKRKRENSEHSNGDSPNTKKNSSKNRTKGSSRKRRKSKKLTREDFINHFHLTQPEAAKALDVCLTTFKNAFSKIPLRWPTPSERKLLLKQRKQENLPNQSFSAFIENMTVSQQDANPAASTLSSNNSSAIAHSIAESDSFAAMSNKQIEQVMNELKTDIENQKRKNEMLRLLISQQNDMLKEMSASMGIPFQNPLTFGPQSTSHQPWTPAAGTQPLNFQFQAPPSSSGKATDNNASLPPMSLSFGPGTSAPHASAADDTSEQNRTTQRNNQQDLLTSMQQNFSSPSGGLFPASCTGSANYLQFASPFFGMSPQTSNFTHNYPPASNTNLQLDDGCEESFLTRSDDKYSNGPQLAQSAQHLQLPSSSYHQFPSPAAGSDTYSKGSMFFTGYDQ